MIGVLAETRLAESAGPWRVSSPSRPLPPGIVDSFLVEVAREFGAMLRIGNTKEVAVAVVLSGWARPSSWRSLECVGTQDSAAAACLLGTWGDCDLRQTFRMELVLLIHCGRLVRANPELWTKRGGGAGC
jgi:hypothetical protein